MRGTDLIKNLSAIPRAWPAAGIVGDMAKRRDGQFQLVSPFGPAGDQPKAIQTVVDALNRGEEDITLLGVTGSGKTFTMANIVQQVQRPTLVLAHNKTLAAQLVNEFREFFPHNAVEYFVSYYDYYQPEAYVVSSDTFIEKDSSVNDEIERLRHQATMGLMTRNDVLIVASVSCIYGLGSPELYEQYHLMIHTGLMIEIETVMRRLVELQYARNDIAHVRGTFRVRGDTLDVISADGETTWRLEFFGDEVERILKVNPLTGEILGEFNEVNIFPNTHYLSAGESLVRAIAGIEAELAQRLDFFTGQNKLLEAQRLRMRTNHDLEMLREVGICKGIENYSRHLDGRKPGETPWTLLDYFPDDFLVIIDESHVTNPQIGGQQAGDRSRKVTLVDHGFRLPSAIDNRPLTFDEFRTKVNQVIHVSATPGPFELGVSSTIAELVIRPTGLVDPEIDVRPTTGQIDDVIAEIRDRVAQNQRVLITTLTKKMAEDLTDYLAKAGIGVRYLHSGIDTVQRIEILRELRTGVFDVLVGINLLREGLDLPEVGLVVILDADKEGFLRSATSLIQTIGRAARNAQGKIIMYADRMTDSMRLAIDETLRRRSLQMAYNEAHGITPQTISKPVGDIIAQTRAEQAGEVYVALDANEAKTVGAPQSGAVELQQAIDGLTDEMHAAAAALKFELAAKYRDEIADLRAHLRAVLEAETR